jgi:hypothetical protein
VQLHADVRHACRGAVQGAGAAKADAGGGRLDYAVTTTNPRLAVAATLALRPPADASTSGDAAPPPGPAGAGKKEAPDANCLRLSVKPEGPGEVPKGGLGGGKDGRD